MTKFYEEMLSRKAEVEKEQAKIREDLNETEARLQEIETQKAAAVRSHDQKAFTDLCSEQEYLREFASSTQEYLKALDYRLPADRIKAAWREEKAQAIADAKKLEPKIMKAANALFDIYEELMKQRNQLNARQSAYVECMEPEPSITLDYSVTMNEFPYVYALQRFLQSIDVIDHTGKRIKH